ncbi:MAG TPA: CpXC domain-containing protein [Ktedonobacteraceae bacterium]|nr:CpXC domain-containing protein [Ktedonobacteraceae bacterium]
MSRSTTHTFTCPCGQVFSSQTYEYVNVAKDPLLRYVVLAGLLNVSTCPNCGRRAAIATPFIYSDPAYELLAYVHPRSDAPEEARLIILEKLRSVYADALVENGQQDHVNGNGGRSISITPSQAKEMPPLQVVFGIDQLNELLNAVLSPEERLGRLALSTRSRSEAERGQFLDIARKLSSEMSCCIEVEDLPDEYTVWLYGSRRQIGALMRELAPRG